MELLNRRFRNLLNICYHTKLKDVPKILETPYVGETLDDKNRLYPPYFYEIKSLKNKKFDDKFLEHILETYKR